jgi:hypothetical protein
MNDYVLKNKPEPAANEMVWAFDLGKGSIGSPGGVALVDEFPGVAGVTPRGEAVRRGNEFLHKASLLIPAEFAETKTAAGRRRMWAHGRHTVRRDLPKRHGRIDAAIIRAKLVFTNYGKR